MVKQCVLADLRLLANENRAHLWSESNIRSITSFAECCDASSGSAILCGSLSIMCDLVKHTDSVQKFGLRDSTEMPVLDLCRNCCYEKNFTVAARATQFLTLLAATCVKEMHQVDD